MLEVVRSRCEWYGRLPVAQLFEQHAISAGEAVQLSSPYCDKLEWQAALAGPPSTDIRVSYSCLQPSSRETLAGLSRSSTMRRPPHMNKVALIQILLLLRSGRSPEDRIAVREPAKASNYLEMASGLADGMLIKRSQAPGGLERDPLRRRHDTPQPFLVAWAFRGTVGHKEDRLLPRLGEGVVLAVPQSLLGNLQGAGIGSVSLGRAREQAARKLVEDNDQ
jgi:hypothetical protein